MTVSARRYDDLADSLRGRSEDYLLGFKAGVKEARRVAINQAPEGYELVMEGNMAPLLECAESAMRVRLLDACVGENSACPFDCDHDHASMTIDKSKCEDRDDEEERAEDKRMEGLIT